MALPPVNTIENELKRALAYRRVPHELRVIYDDMHELWGGQILTVYGDGRLERQIRARGGVPSKTDHRQIGEALPLELVRLLVELSAWEQRTVDVPPVPDESRPAVTIHMQGSTSRVWERFEEMPANGRLLWIRDWIESQLNCAPD